MITNKGQSVLTKYLVGQAPSYAAYMAIGCGAKPRSTLSIDDPVEVSSFKNKKSLDFEMMRVPIISKGYVTEPVRVITITNAIFNPENGLIQYYVDNAQGFIGTGTVVDISGITPSNFNFSNAIVKFANAESFWIQAEVPTTVAYSAGGFVTLNATKVVFTAELPTEERYEITEIGIYPAQANPSAGSNDSKTVYAFTQSENWQYHGANVETMPSVYSPLAPNEADVISGSYTVINDQGEPVFKELKAFHTNADNTLFANQSRRSRNENCRYLNNIIMLRGDLANLSYSNNKVNYVSGEHIHLNNQSSFNFDKNSPSDELRLAFSVINKNGNLVNGEIAKPSAVRILIEFSSSDVYNVGNTARFEVNLTHIAGDPLYDLSTNRYFVISKKINELTQSSGFSWGLVNNVKIYACAMDSSNNPTSDFYIGLDALRLENVTTVNPIYGLVGYSVIKTDDGLPIIKNENTSSLVEFRFGLDIL